MTRSLRLLLALAVMTLAAPAAAVCISSTSCFCADQQPFAIVGVHVTALTGARTEVTTDDVRRGPLLQADAGIPEVSVVPRDASDTVGKRLLLYVTTDGQLVKRLGVDADGQLTCTTTGFRLPETDVVNAAFSADCAQHLYRAGFEEPPCDDTPGCSTGVGGPVLLGLALVALRLRRRRA